MTLSLTENLHDLAEILGPLPSGDTPAAWWYSTHEDVLAGYDKFGAEHTAWRGRMKKLYDVGGFTRKQRHAWKPAERIRVSGLGDGWLVGIYPPPFMIEPPRFWRLTKQGVLVPRRYTLMEKNSPVNKLFQQCRQIPRAVDYLPGLPNTLWIPGVPPEPTCAYPVHVRRPGEAVLAFVGMPPEGAHPPFDPEPECWVRLKLSTWHLLKERQAATSDG